MKIALVAMLALVCAVSNAEARQRHRVADQKYDPACNVTMPCEGVGKPVVSAKESAVSPEASSYTTPCRSGCRRIGRGVQFSLR